MVTVMTESFGNANSVDHDFGHEAATLIENARTDVAALVGADSDEVLFTSGSTEGIRLALRHATTSQKARPLRVAASVVEHRAVLDALSEVEAESGARVSWLPVDGKARLDLDALRHTCREGVDLVCVIAANNEVGTISALDDIVELTSAYDVDLMVDATQAAGKMDLSFDSLNLAYLCLSAHKIYGPKGIGALVARAGPRMRGERAAGHGTPNVPGIVGLGSAAKLRAEEWLADENRVRGLRNELQDRLLNGVPDLMINGDVESRLAGNLHISVPGVPNDVVVARLRGRVAISTGAACVSGAQAGSHVLRAMGLPHPAQAGALRIGLGKFTTSEEIDLAAEAIAGVISAIRDAR